MKVSAGILLEQPKTKLQKMDAAIEEEDSQTVAIRLFSEAGAELSQAPIVVPASARVEQLQQLYQQLLRAERQQRRKKGKNASNDGIEEEDDDDELPPIQFRTLADEEGSWKDIVDTLRDSLPQEQILGEKPLDLVCLPQAIFRVRPVTRCAASLPGHGEPVISVQFSPDGSCLASGSGDKTVRLWDLQTQLPLRTLHGHMHWVLCIAWSPCGQRLASACKRGDIFLWDVSSSSAGGGASSSSTSNPLARMHAHKQWVCALAWQPLHVDPKCRLLASASRDTTIRIWDTQLGSTLRVLSGHTASVTALRWGGCGLIYSGSQDRTVKVWRADDGTLCRTLSGHAHWINTLALCCDYVLRVGFFSAEAQSAGKPIERPESGNLEEIQRQARHRYEKVVGQPAVERLVSGSDDFTMILWEPAEKKQPIARMSGHQQLVNQVQFSPDTRFIASASFDKSIKLWDGKTGKFLASLRGHVSAVYQLAWSSDSRLIVSGSADSTLKVWNVRSAKLKLDLPGHGDEVFAVDWSPNGEHVASGGKDKLLRLWRR